jgi:transforming growth factor-beta-induced protein
MKMRFELFLKLSQIFLLVLSAEKADADYQNRSHAFNNPSKEKPQNITEINEGTKRKNETLSPFDYLSDALLENDLKQMCSIMSNAETQQIVSTMEGDYTILAPSDEAFGLIPGSKLDELKNNAQKRREFILRHIIPGRLILKQFGPNDETEVKSVDNTQLHLTAYPNGYVINGANVVNGDIPITNTNNLIHIIDRVLYPKQELNLLELMEQNPDLSQMLSFLTLSGLQNELTANNSLTIFCPNDEAFRAIPWPVTQQMLSNNTFLRLLMANPIIAGKHYSTGLAGNQLYSIGGDVLNLTSRTIQSRKLILVNSVPIVGPDLIAMNGVIHIITRIMLPKPLLDD